MKTRLGVSFEIDFAHTLRGHPKCGKPHGHTSRIIVEVQGDVKKGGSYEENMVIEFDKMKKTSFVINTSRGEIINEDDLIIALSTNVIAGAGIDVYAKEPLPSTHKLRFIPNALILPHLGYVTVENYSMFYKQMIENLDACVSGKPIRVINE